MVLPIGMTLMRLWRPAPPSSMNQPMTGSQTGLARRTVRWGCDSANGMFSVARVWLGGAATLIRCSCADCSASQVLGAPGAEALVGHEVVVHRRLAVVPEVQHARAAGEKCRGVVEQHVQRHEAGAV